MKNQTNRPIVYEKKYICPKLLGFSKSFESGNENTFFFGEITFIAEYNLP